MTADELFSRFKSLRILVVGDLMVDRYLWGRVSRISPEAPVPVVDVNREENRLGGAANVALNLVALGATPVMLGVVGHDAEGASFLEICETMRLPTDGVMISRERRTTTKIRVIGNNQQMLRVDKEDTHPLSAAELGQVHTMLKDTLDRGGIHAIVFEDYDKGMLSAPLIAEIVAKATARGIPTFVDPKFANFWAYKHVTVFKPNLKEVREAMKEDLPTRDIPALAAAVEHLRTRLEAQHVLLTLSENGVLLSSPAPRAALHVPAHLRAITDVSGAGDTVISTFSACWAAGCTPEASTRIANLAGGLVCEHVGVVPVDAVRLKAEIEQHQALG
jgi:rfaE bifunctional protein kinase chain/domain